jgi:hypothetical protein
MRRIKEHSSLITLSSLNYLRRKRKRSIQVISLKEGPNLFRINWQD